MFYEFECACGEVVEESFRMGECPKSIKCPKCGKKALRVFSAPAIKSGGVFKSGGTSFGNAVRKMNDDAAKRMKGRDKIRTVAYDHGGGDIREV